MPQISSNRQVDRKVVSVGLAAIRQGLSRNDPNLTSRMAATMADNLLLQAGKYLADGYSLALAKMDDTSGQLDLVVLKLVEGLNAEREKPSDVVIAQRKREEFSVIRVRIDGAWSVTEMRQFLSYIEDIYNFTLTLVLMRNLSVHSSLAFGSDRGRVAVLTGSPWIFPQDSALNVKRIRYGSPGITDLAGVGVIVGHVKEFLEKILEYLASKEQRKLENQERRLKNQQLQIANTKSLVDLAREAGCSKAEIRELVKWLAPRSNGLLELASKGNIRSIQLLAHTEE